MPRGEHLARVRMERAARRAVAPTCTAMRGKRKKAVCGKRMDQNEVERARGTFWCTACGRYTDGSKGFPRINS